jgi:uncharacterized protein (TIGR03435 family)
LTGFYDVTRTFKLDPTLNANPLARAGAMPPADPEAPDLFTIVQEQLGLRLENQRGPIDVVVVERIERPTLD